MPKTSFNEEEQEDLQQRYKRGDFQLILDSAFPRAGPTTGKTRVTIRAEGINDLVNAFPSPKCRFGTNDMVTDAAYVKCSKRPAHN